MKKLLSICVILVGILCVLSPAQPQEFARQTLTIAGVQRVFVTVAPPDLGPGRPVVILLHGGGQSIDKVLQKDRATRRWVDLAGAEKFSLLVPSGVSAKTQAPDGNSQQWNDCRKPGPDFRAGISTALYTAIRN